MTSGMPLGRVIVDLAGTSMTGEEAELLRDPQVGGVILFARNYESPEQLLSLTRSIRALRAPSLLIAVDHEGGRVQRFREGFCAIPPMRDLGRLWDRDPARAQVIASDCGLVIASELAACGVDLSFTPVLDLDVGISTVIGSRAFHGDAQAVCDLATALMGGLAEGGMAACGKHFPGHGHVAADSHVAIPVDGRELSAIEASDLIPFRRLVAAGLSAIMPAHVIYPKVDAAPAGFSQVWHRLLRDDLGFRGIAFSDDLSMEGAKAGGGVIERALAALDAGCDMLLLCNDPASARTLVDGMGRLVVGPVDTARFARVRPRPAIDIAPAQAARLSEARARIATLA
jgi:beta-N-acetylhexosaminidase